MAVSSYLASLGQIFVRKRCWFARILNVDDEPLLIRVARELLAHYFAIHGVKLADDRRLGVEHVQIVDIGVHAEIQLPIVLAVFVRQAVNDK